MPSITVHVAGGHIYWIMKTTTTNIINVTKWIIWGQLADSDIADEAPVTPGLRPGYDQPATEKWVNRRKNVRLVVEVVRLVAEVVGDCKGQISRNKVDGHVQNLKPAIPNRKRSHD